jgi:hypothetical protein
MRKIMKQLLALQMFEFGPRSGTAESQAEMAKLRDKVPSPILAHYERLVARGKKGVAIARHGVCSECHLRITSGRLASLVYTNEIQLCDNCGRYLYLPDDEPLGLTYTPTFPPVPLKNPWRKAAPRVA